MSAWLPHVGAQGPVAGITLLDMEAVLSLYWAGWLAGWPPVEALGLPIGTQSPALSDAEVKLQSICQHPFHFGGEEQGFMYKKTLLCLSIMPAGSGLNLHLQINQPPCKLQDQHTITH